MAPSALFQHHSAWPRLVSNAANDRIWGLNFSSCLLFSCVAAYSVLDSLHIARPLVDASSLEFRRAGHDLVFSSKLKTAGPPEDSDSSLRQCYQYLVCSACRRSERSDNHTRVSGHSAAPGAPGHRAWNGLALLAVVCRGDRPRACGPSCPRYQSPVSVAMLILENLLRRAQAWNRGRPGVGLACHGVCFRLCPPYMI